MSPILVIVKLWDDLQLENRPDLVKGIDHVNFGRDRAGYFREAARFFTLTKRTKRDAKGTDDSPFERMTRYPVRYNYAGSVPDLHNRIAQKVVAINTHTGPPISTTILRLLADRWTTLKRFVKSYSRYESG